ncbi:MAG TPA: ABC transporter permease, partial [Vicinamibacterales bacterium]|nr:ABC transporter permease [Vicinamibacterales bacterium]
RDRQIVFWNFGFFPLLLMLFLGALSGGEAAVRVALTSAVVTLAVAANALFSLGVGLSAARAQGVFRRFALAPIPAWAAPTAIAAARALLVAAAALVQVLLARALFGVSWSGSAAAILALLLFGTTAFASLGFMVAALAPAPHVANVLVNSILLPMIALGGVALPLEMLPPGAAAVGRMLPSAALDTGLKGSLVAGATLSDVGAELALLAGWAIAAGAAGALRWRGLPA